MRFIIILFSALIITACKQSDNKTDPVTGSRTDTSVPKIKIPVKRGYVNDYYNFFTAAESKSLDSLVTSYEKKTTTEIVVATLDSTMTEYDLDDYSLLMFNSWGIGKKIKNNGILIAIAPELRRLRIQNGYGIEKILSDEETKVIIDSIMTPSFKKAKYFEGTKKGIMAIIKKLDSIK